MPQTGQVTLTQNGTSPPIWVDLRNFKSGGAGLFLTITGTLTATVQVTGDDNSLPEGPIYWNDLDGMTALTASINGNLAFPCTAIRLAVAGYSSGVAVLTIVQIDTEAP
jgi:hypothetical protein